MPPPCPLCAAASRPYHRDTRRSYWQCADCALVFVPEAEHLDPAQEKAQYDLHSNDPDDPGYRRFLSRLATPLAARLAAGADGLDFGCGPGPALVAILREQGFTVQGYDPFYAPDQGLLARTYDFITATEVIEHLRKPRHDLARLWAMVKPGGWLAVMTKQVRDRTAFAGWHYTHDPTHIAFYSHATFLWLGAQWGAQPEFHGDDVVLLQKPAT